MDYAMLKKYAKLDETGVYVGMEQLEESQLTDKHLAHITECDLTPGKYYWDYNQKRFEPIVRAKGSISSKLHIGEPDIHKALADLFDAMGVSVLPESTKAWLAWYRKTYDNKQDFDKSEA